MKWRIQREKFGLRMFDPDSWMWFAYPPERDRQPYMFAKWHEAIAWADHYSSWKAAGCP